MEKQRCKQFNVRDIHFFSSFLFFCCLLLAQADVILCFIYSALQSKSSRFFFSTSKYLLRIYVYDLNLIIAWLLLFSFSMKMYKLHIKFPYYARVCSLFACANRQTKNCYTQMLEKFTRFVYWAGKYSITWIHIAICFPCNTSLGQSLKHYRFSFRYCFVLSYFFLHSIR